MKTRTRFLSILLAILMLCTVSVYALSESTSTPEIQQHDTSALLYDYPIEDISNIHMQDTHAAFVLQDNTLVCVNSSTSKAELVYTAEYEIQLVVPYYDEGVMFGSALPTNPDGTSFDASELRHGLSWDGTYEYLDYATGEVSTVSNPNQVYIVASSGFTNNVSYTATIQGVTVPFSNYTNGSRWQSTQYDGNFGSGFQCHGFALYIYDRLFGNWGQQINRYGAAPTQSFLQSLALGTLIRVNDVDDNSLTPHSMILIGRDSGGVYIYHANWIGTNVVTVSYATWSQFTATFPYVNYYICPHNI